MPNAFLGDVKRSKVVANVQHSLTLSLPGNHSPRLHPAMSVFLGTHVSQKPWLMPLVLTSHTE